MTNNSLRAEVVFYDKVNFPQEFYSCLLLSGENRLDCRIYFDDDKVIAFPAKVLVTFLDMQKAQDVLSKNKGKFSIWEFGVIGEGNITEWDS